jgi:transcriptional regulator with XRE-family HTH domain
MNILATKNIPPRICFAPPSRLDDGRMPTFADKVRLYRKRLGMDQSAFADFLAISQPTVSRWENGALPESENIIRLANISETDLNYWVDDDAPGPRLRSSLRVLVVGHVDGGDFQEAIEWSPEDQFDIEIPATKEFESLELKAFVVRGPSMNLVYPEDSFVIVVPTLKNGIRPKSGARVIVQSRNKSGLYEATIKEYVVDENGREWLWPRSHDPEYQAPLQLLDPRGEIDSVEIIAVVVGAYAVEDLDKIILPGPARKGKPK